jgi:hypothetical protein
MILSHKSQARGCAPHVARDFISVINHWSLVIGTHLRCGLLVIGHWSLGKGVAFGDVLKKGVVKQRKPKFLISNFSFLIPSRVRP